MTKLNSRVHEPSVILSWQAVGYHRSKIDMYLGRAGKDAEANAHGAPVVIVDLPTLNPSFSLPKGRLTAFAAPPVLHERTQNKQERRTWR